MCVYVFEHFVRNAIKSNTEWMIEIVKKKSYLHTVPHNNSLFFVDASHSSANKTHNFEVSGTDMEVHVRYGKYGIISLCGNEMDRYSTY